MAEIPQGLHSTQYGHKLLENIGLPPITSNVKLMGDCIASISKAQKIRPDEAYVWLYKRVKWAQDAGERINFLWFSNGDYNLVKLAREVVRSTFLPVDKAALAKEQATPEWAEAARTLRNRFAVIAGKKEM